MARQGILGGTFNPVHWGHVAMAEAALMQAHLDRILWIPAGDPPHKPLAAGATTAQRLEMVKRAIEHYPHFHYCSLEIERQGPSYGVITVAELRQRYPQDDWFWVIGADAFVDLPKWHRVGELVGQVTWLIAPRDGETDLTSLVENVQKRIGQPLRAQPLQMTSRPVSSTTIREACQRRQSIRAYVPPAVASYIEEQGLYQESGHATQHEKR